MATEIDHNHDSLYNDISPQHYDLKVWRTSESILSRSVLRLVRPLSIVELRRSQGDHPDWERLIELELIKVSSEFAMPVTSCLP